MEKSNVSLEWLMQHECVNYVYIEDNQGGLVRLV